MLKSVIKLFLILADTSVKILLANFRKIFGKVHGIDFSEVINDPNNFFNFNFK